MARGAVPIKEEGLKLPVLTHEFLLRKLGWDDRVLKIEVTPVVITHPYRADQAAVRSGTRAARASRMAASAVRPARRPVATTEQRSA
jgi:hypothetical protein